MPNTKTLVPFKGTKEQEEQLRAAIEANRNTPGLIMPILQKAQELYGYLPEEVLLIISEEINVSMSELYGVVSFYTQFTLNPKGVHEVAVCMGTACYVKNAGGILARAEKILNCKANSISEDGKFSIDATRCVGACGLAPIIIVDGNVYGRITVEDVDGILQKYL
jgi:NADH:ubiquinone oxidoreductase subunit E